LVFIDETAANTKMSRLSVPQGPLENSYVRGRPMPQWNDGAGVDGSMNGKTFLAYVEQSLGPTLKRNDMVMMDNLPTRKVPAATTFVLSCAQVHCS
jgi:hypothetical protein